MRFEREKLCGSTKIRPSLRWLRTQPRQRLGANELVSLAFDPLALQISRRPIQIGAGHVGAGRYHHTAHCRGDRSRAGIREQIEKASSGRKLAEHGACPTLI